MKSKKSMSFLLAMVIMIFTLLSALPKGILNLRNEVYADQAKGEVILTFDNELAPEYKHYKKVVSTKLPPVIELWHYSGGYWGNSQVKIVDSTLKGDIARNLENEFMKKVGGESGYKIDTLQIPEAVKKALAEGKNVVAQVKSYTEYPIQDFIHHTDDISKHTFKIKGDKIEFRTFPKFNYQRSSDGDVIAMQDFDLDNRIRLPFVKDGFGSNGWSIYNAKGGRSGEWASYSNWQEWNNPGGSKISYQKMLKNSSGRMEAGHSIFTTKGNFASETIGIGDIGNFKSGGSTALHFLYPLEYNYYIEEEATIIEDIILTNLQLFEKGGYQPIATFKREIVDPLDPLNPAKQKISGDFITPDNPASIDKDKKYELRATYQFISFLEGEFDITKYYELIEGQKNLNTGVTSNLLTEGKAYDEKAFMQGVFDEANTLNENSPMMSMMMNLEIKHFKWDYEWDNTKKELVKLAGFIPEGHFPAEKNQNPLNDWGTVYAKIKQNDMGLSKLKLFGPDGKEVTHFEIGKKYTTNVVVKHEDGDSIIGENPTTNPKPKINYKVTDAKGVILPDNPKQTVDVLRPKQELTVPKSNEFSSDENIIRVCATIDAIHRDLGYNQDPANDTICKEFQVTSAKNDIGLFDLKLYDSGGREVEFIEPNKSYTTDVVARHVVGKEVIGTDPVKNPKVKVAYKVVEIGNRVILPDNNKTTTTNLAPQATITMPKSNSFSSTQGFVKVCATIDKQHTDLGYNFDPNNDTVCREFEMVKNYSVISFESSPKGINFGKNENILRNHPVRLTFKIGNETHKGANDKLPSSVPVEIKYKGITVWNQSVSVSPGEAKEFSAGINVDLIPGDNNFTIEVNPSRAQVEFKPGMSDPYSDNKKELSIRGTQYQECQECLTNAKNTRNEWVEEWKWQEQRGTVLSSTYKKCMLEERRIGTRCTDTEEYYVDEHWVDTWYGGYWAGGYWSSRCTDWEDYYYYVCIDERDIPYQYCSVNYSKSWTEKKNYYEEYKINKVEFGSKFHEDTEGTRMINIRDGGEAGIKAGYGFELEIETTYQTNRGVAPLPNPYQGNPYRGDVYGRYGSGYCDFITRFPGVTPINAPTYIYVEMPYFDRSGSNVCYILSDYRDSGSWNSLKRTFMLPMRQSPTGAQQRRIYINEGAQPNNKTGRKSFPIKIVTPRPDKPDRFYGYEPENQIGTGKSRPKSYLHDCHTIYVVIFPMDDVKSHIIQ